MSEEQQDRITVLIVEDHPMFRDALRGYIEIRSDAFQLVGETDNASEALALVEETVPDVVLLDLELRHDTEAGLEAIREIRAVSPETKVIVLTAHRENELVFPAIKAGAVAYLLKENVHGKDVADIIHQVHEGQPPLDPDIAQKLWSYFQGIIPTEGEPLPYQEKLTRREQEVLELIVQRKTNREIADALVISVKTVKTHVSNMLHKLHLSNRTELRMYAVATRSELGRSSRG
jgi:NarL family two-component system response regulator LiaR